LAEGHAARDDETEGDGGIQMRAGDVAEGVYYGHHHESESKRNAGVRNGTVSRLIDHDRAGACEDEAKGAEELGYTFFS
jgi:hypothetical protein